MVFTSLEGLKKKKKKKSINSFSLQEREGCNFLDIGANIGTYTIPIANQGINVTCVEASLKNRMVLKENIRLNGLEDRFTLIPYGVADKEKYCTLFYYGGNQGNIEAKCDDEKIDQNMLKNPNIHFLNRIHLKTLDSFLDRPYCAMKMDIENKEYYALKGMKNYFKKYCIKYILFECHSHSRVNDMFNLLDGLGYTLSLFMNINKSIDYNYFSTFEGGMNFVAKHKDCQTGYLPLKNLN